MFLDVFMLQYAAHNHRGISFVVQTFKSIAMTLPTTRCNIQKFYTLLELHLCVLFGVQNIQQRLPYTELTDRFL